MKVAKDSKSRRRNRWSVPVPAPADRGLVATTLPPSRLVATLWGGLDVKRRASLLGNLLGSVGPLALAVVGGGAFAGYLQSVRCPFVRVSFQDAALATSSQVYELVRYVEQSNPSLLDGMLNALTQDGLTMTALGASAAAIAIRHISERGRSAVRTPRGRPRP